MKNRVSGSGYEALRVLLTSDKPLTVKQIQAQMLIPLDRKQVYNLMNTLEVLGYKVERGKTRPKGRGAANTYKVTL